MYRGNGALVTDILQIRIKHPKLIDKKHPFIDNRAAGKRTDIRKIIGLLEHPAYNIQSAVKCQPFFHSLRPFYKPLHNTRHTVRSFFSQFFRRCRHFSPAEKLHAFFLYDHLKHLHRTAAFQFILRKEKHPHAKFPFSAQPDAKRSACLRKKPIGNLQQNTDAIPGLSIRIFSCSVLQVFNNL